MENEKPKRERRKIEIQFDYSKLSEKDRKIYDTMSPKDKAEYEKQWIQVEKQKEKLRISKARLSKKTTAYSLASRKTDAHRKIQCGGVVAEILNRPLNDDDWKMLRAFLLDQESRGEKVRGKGNGFFTSFASSFFKNLEKENAAASAVDSSSPAQPDHPDDLDEPPVTEDNDDSIDQILLDSFDSKDTDNALS